VPRDFRLQVLCINQFFLKPLNIPLRTFQFFLKIRGDILTTSVVDTVDKWKKSSIRKFLIILFGHLCVVELPYRNFFSTSSLSSLSILILFSLFAAGINDTSCTSGK
jgi:hypothetical protein